MTGGVAMFPKDIELVVSSESIRRYAEIAHKHLHKHNSTIEVALAGVDEEGKKIFGILLVSDGEEEWYDPEGSNTLVGWGDENDAYVELEDKILPQMGYVVFQQDLQQFHRCMGEL